MGSGLCRRKDGKRRALGVEGLYRKIVFNCPKQWTRCSNKRPKSDKNDTKPNRSKRKKPIISGPYPVDPDRLEGDKWRYVILTRLDTEPPPERPPRTKRHRAHDSAGFGRWGSVQRRRRSSCGRGSGRRPPRPGRRAVDGHGGHHRQQQPLSAEQLMALVLNVYRRRGPAGRSLAWPRGRDRVTVKQRCGPGATGAAGPGPRDEPDSGRGDRPGTIPGTALVEKPTSPWMRWLCAGRGPIADHCNGLFVHHRRYRRNGFFGSVGRVRAMANDLLSL